jgi:hypothetical protein
MGWLTLKLFYHTTDNYSEETRWMWTLAEVREYAQMVFDLSNQEFALHLVADHKKINTDRELWIAWRPYRTRSGDARLHLKVVVAAATLAAPAAPLAPESDDEMEVEEEDEEASAVVGGVVVDVVVVGIRI